MDRKTLYGHLAGYGLTYSSILDTIRVDLAIPYARDKERSLSNVASLLGFASLSAFSRWFSRRFGQSVSAWRRATTVVKEPS
jgi:AraC-like DNA-binding protein